MKFLAWVMFLTSTACFVAVFCKQQWEAEISDTTTMFAQPTEAWRMACAMLPAEEVSDAAGGGDAGVAATQPTFAASDPAAALASHETVAAGDVSDATK